MEWMQRRNDAMVRTNGMNGMNALLSPPNDNSSYGTSIPMAYPWKKQTKRLFNVPELILDSGAVTQRHLFETPASEWPRINRIAVSTYLSTYLPIYLSIHQTIYLSTYFSIKPSVYLSISHLAIHLSIYLWKRIPATEVHKGNLPYWERCNITHAWLRAAVPMCFSQLIAISHSRSDAPNRE